MKASETTFQHIIEGTKQYIVPLFQRPYSWKKENWHTLWEDLLWLCENEEFKSHFIGSIVTMPTGIVPEGILKFLLIDGQQRLTTIIILLTVIRNKAREDGLEQFAQEIDENLLFNKFKAGLDNYKLLPTQADRESFQAMVKNQESNEDSKVIECFQFFERKLKIDASIDLSKLRTAVTNRLSVVRIVLESNDDPYLVFESLNAKGLRLTQADLIRNYFLMRINVNEQEAIFNRLWRPMQEALDANQMTEFIRHYLMRNGTFVKQGDVYFVLKERIGQADAVTFLEEIFEFSKYYKKILSPESEPDEKLRNLLKRIQRLEVTTAYPFLLNCYHDYRQQRLTAEEFQKILLYLENYLIRRFICNYKSNELNKIFPALYNQAQLESPSNLTEGVRLILQQRGYPKDTEFHARLVEAKLYGAGDRRRITKLLLETLETSYGHKEQAIFDNLSIEHVMPQTPTEWWQENLGEDWQTTHELWLHTLGNLTLTGYNSELSNSDFPTKKELLSQSHLELNNYFENLNVWRQPEIERRSNDLAKAALKIWEYFGDAQSSADVVSADDDPVTGKTPRTLTFLGKTFLVSSWRDVLESTMDVIAELEPEGFETLSREYPRFISPSEMNLRSSRKLSNGFFIETNLSARSIHRFCTQAIESIGLSAADWVVETS